MRAADLEKLIKVTRRRGEWRDGLCPAHDDQRASLSWRDGDRRVILTCRAGCTDEQIAAGLRIAVADLYFASATRTNGGAPHGREVCAYDYRDPRGALLYQVVRLADPKDFRMRRPDGRGGWTWKAGPDVPRVVYRLPDLAKQRRVFWPEGEKDVDRLWSAGIPATTSPGGANAFRKGGERYARQIVEAAIRDVVVIPDNDEAGRSYARDVANALHRTGCTVRMLTLPGLPDKGDVSDWLDGGHDAAELQALADAAPVWAPAGDAPVLVCLGDVEAAPVAWDWPGRIARGRVALIVGDVGAGKTTVTLDMTARKTGGADWPDGGRPPEGPVILLTSEDGLADTVRAIIDRQGGDARRVYVLQAVRTEGGEHPFTLERDLGALETAIKQTGAAWVVISPLSAYLGSKDSYRDAEIRGLLTPLAALAETLRVAIVGIMHLTKAQQARLLSRVQGSVAFVAQARTVLVVGEDPNVAGRRLFASLKNSYGPKPATLAFRIDDHGLTWEPDPVAGPAETLLAQDQAETRTEARERTQAETFLRELLTPLPVKSTDVHTAAKANGIAQRTLWRAKANLGVTAERAKGDAKAPWYWIMPAEESTS
jgi:hypothetical protein